MIKCQCNRNNIFHKANECNSEATVITTQQDGVRRYLCSDCTSLGDVDTYEIGIKNETKDNN